MDDAPTIGPEGPDNPRGHRWWIWICLGAGLLILSSGVLLVTVLGQRSSSTASSDDRAVETIPAVTTSAAGTVPPATVPPATLASVPPTPTTVRPMPSPERAIVPTNVNATSTLDAQRGGCDGKLSTYGASNVIDGDPQTAWSSRESNGSGQHLMFHFGSSTELTQIGVIPGYAKEGPLTWNGCRSVSRFDLNRQVVRVRYTFDDGSTIEQSFESTPVMQWLPVSTITSSVDVEILETVLPPGPHVDDDTLISEVGFRGR